MTAITASSLPLSPRISAVAPITFVPETTQDLTQATPSAPAAVVALGEAERLNAIDTPLYSPSGRLAQGMPAPLWESTEQNKVTDTIASNVGALKTATRFRNLGAAVLSQFAASGSGFSQSVLRAVGTSVPDASALSAMQSNLHTHAANTIGLTIKTASGATVTVSLSSSTDGLGAQVSVSGGKLSDRELAAIGQMAEGFQAAIDGLGATPPKLSLDGLAGFDKTVLTSVDLSAKLKGSDIKTLSFSADANQRSVSLSSVQGDLQLSVDTGNATVAGSAQQQAKALEAYLAKFDAARARGHGDKQLMDLFKDAFKGLNSHVDSAAAGAGSPLLSKADRGLLTGLADFSASISQTAQLVNPMRPAEVDSFAYSVSQSTRLKGTLADRSIDQQQQSHLSASYHQSLYPGAALQLGSDRSSQNYTYYKIDDNASSGASIAYKNGALVAATLSQSGTQSSTALKYVMGRLESTVTTPQSTAESSSVKDLLDAVLHDKGVGSAARNQQVIDRLHERVLAALDSAS